jgi:N-acetylglucosaminyldiphosphoundecaprenol N-acetyl-beta-D-mannosaminyltransferase
MGDGGPSRVVVPAPALAGISFFGGSLQQAIAASAAGGLVVAPSGPGLADIDRQPLYRRALQAADMVLADSGVMVLLARCLHGTRVPRISGYRFLCGLLDAYPAALAGDSLWLMPGEDETKRNVGWLAGRGIHLDERQLYHAPHYGAVPEDELLLARIMEQRPAWIIINIGGGVQEPLGAWLQAQLPYRPTIVCTGAALAFLAGGQVYIPLWVDRLYLGWLWRTVSHPRRYGLRYLRALRLVVIMQ